MAFLEIQLELERCPHCQVDKPSLIQMWKNETRDHAGGCLRFWKTYKCARCGGVILAGSQEDKGYVHEMYPLGVQVEDDLPTRAKEFLSQAISSLNAPAGSVMLCASAVDAMLKEKNHKEGNLYSRIDKAATEHVITQDMATWAHEVRLDANDQRHADETAFLPSEADAKKCIQFVAALGQILFVLPAMIKRGLEESKNKKT